MNEVLPVWTMLLRQIIKSLFFILVFIIGIPLFLGRYTGVPDGKVITMVSSAILFQATASPIGLGLGIKPVIILLIMLSYAIGMTLLIFEICDTFAQTSDRVQKWLSKVEEKMHTITVVQRYGVFSCICISWIPAIGLYGTPVIAWLFAWKRIPAILFTVLGFFIVSIFFLILTIGIFW
ncbi:MAG: hypothetical protein JXA44_05730 [Methanospirillaceae archaeon]|nr:hypothetical protein [Methanospirillaceae archaeon]